MTLKLGPLAAFDPSAFTKLLEGRGLDYRWSRALTCSCQLNTHSGQWDPSCDRCGGDGWLYINPNAQSERHLTRNFSPVKAVMSMVGGRPTVTEEIGPWPFGTAQLTVQNALRVGFRDRFIGSEQEMAWSELLVRGADAVPVGPGGRTTALQTTSMRYEPIRINYVEADVAGTAVVYYQGADYTLKLGSGDGVSQMVWNTGAGPADGTQYAIHYDIHPVWVVDQAVYNVQNSRGPKAGLKGSDVLQHLPTTFRVVLDYLTPART